MTETIPVAALRHGSAADCLLGLWVRIPLRAWLCFSCECFVLSGGSLCDGRSPVQRSPTECGVCECDCKASIMWRPWHIRAVSPWRKKSTAGKPAALTLAWYSAVWIRSGWCFVVTSGVNARQLNETPASTASKRTVPDGVQRRG